LELSFIPAIGDEQGNVVTTFVMKIWDGTIRSRPIFDGCDKLIGHYEGRRLVFAAGHSPYKRCFAFQSFWASVKHLGGDFDAQSIPYDLASLDENHRNRFLSIVRAKQLELHHSLSESTDT